MGYYLNSMSALSLYESETKKPYYVDKTEMLTKLIPLVEEGNNHVCISRPKWFGKSVMAAMVAAFFGKGLDSSYVFDSLNIAKPMDDLKTGSNMPEEKTAETGHYKYMNKYNTIFINFAEPANEAHSYDEFISSIKENVQMDLREEFTDVRFRENGTVTQDLKMVFSKTREKFIFVFDEWDCIFHKNYITNNDRKSFMDWLASMTKDIGCVALTYMTGVFPIASYVGGSSIDYFREYTIKQDNLFVEFFGFTETEVDELYLRYESRTSERMLSREDLRRWYGGYCVGDGVKLYNSCSVVSALTSNRITTNWTSRGSWFELSRFIARDIDGLKKDILMLFAEFSVDAYINWFGAPKLNPITKSEIFSTMVTCGFLTYEDGKVRIPNSEVDDEFAKTFLNCRDI